MFETNSEPIVELTPNAVRRVAESMSAEGLEDHGLRLSVVKGGCSGYEYSIKFAPAPAEGDRVYRVESLPVFVDAESLDKLAGTVLDFEEGLYGGGLRFSNPNVSHSCGCGASFATEES